MTPIVVPAYAAIFGIMLVVLSVRVADMRRKTQTALGSGGHKMLERRIRVQGNFTEYVPITLLLLAFAEMQGWWRPLLHILCAALLIARIAHAYGVGQEREDIRIRASATVTTASIIIVTALLLLYGTLK
jgi:uncharacterized membrane protein YecN with MAPEG domain